MIVTVVKGIARGSECRGRVLLGGGQKEAGGGQAGGSG